MKKTVLVVFMAGTVLAGCATIPNAPAALSAAEMVFNTAVSVYDGICLVDSGAAICSAADLAKAASLENAVDAAISAAQAAINVANGDVSAPAVQAAITAVQNAVTQFENFVNQMAAKKAAHLMAIRAK